MKFDKESNTFMIILTVIMSAITSLGLLAVYTSLKPFYLDNIKKEKAMYILNAAGIPATRDNSLELLKKHLIKTIAFKQNGDTININKHFSDHLSQYSIVEEVKNKPRDERIYMVYICKTVNNEIIYVFPMAGKGLWGPIWAYFGVKEDLKTIKSVIFDHEGETPGLGGEIATPEFWKLFYDQEIGDPNSNQWLKIVKAQEYKGLKGTIQGISGGTLTTLGANEMLQTYLPVCYKLLQKSKEIFNAEKKSMS